jgi:hypothetical protein
MVISSSMRTCVYLLLLSVTILQFGCKEVLKDLDELVALQDTLMKKYKVKDVEVKLKNENHLEVSFVNSTYNDSTEEQMKENAYAIKDFIRTVYHSDNIERISVGFVKSNKSAVFPVSNSRSYNMAIGEKISSLTAASWMYTSTSIDTLSHSINLVAFKPEKTKWVIKILGNPNSRVPGPADFCLEAFMTFDDASINKIRNNSKVVSYIPGSDSSYKFNWLDSNCTWNNSVKDTTRIPVYDPFLFKSDYYSHGGFIIHKNDVILSLYTQ